MNLGNAIGNFLIGNTDPNSDPLAVSTGMGEGQAQVLPRYTGEAWQQATQNRQRQQQLDLEAQKQKQAAEAPKNDILETLDKIGGYRPQEFKNIQMRKEQLEKEVLSLDSSAPDYPQKLASIRNKMAALKEGVVVSRDISTAYNKANEVLNSGKYWFPKEVKDKIESDYKEDYGVIPDDYAWMDKLAPKAATVDLLQNAEPLIKDYPAYITNIVKSSTMGEPEIVPQKGANGQVVNKIVSYTDPQALEANMTAAWSKSGQLQEQYPDLNDFLNEGKNRAVFKGRTEAKYAPTNKNVSVGGNTVEAGNVVFNPPIPADQAQTLLQNKAYTKYVDDFNKSQAKIEADTKLTKSEKEKAIESLAKQFKTKEEFNAKFTFSKKGDVVPYSIKGVAENPKHQFTTVIDGKDVQVYGQSNLYNSSEKAFVVETDKGTVLAPVSKNTQYLSDNGMTTSDFNMAIEKVKGGKVVTTNKEGNVVKTESTGKKWTYNGKTATEADWLKAGWTPEQLKKHAKAQ